MSPLPPFAASPSRSDGQFSTAVPAALQALLERYGPALLDEAGRLRGMLFDEVPSAKREISVLMLALDEQVPQDLVRASSREADPGLVPRLVRRLVDEKALALEAAHWAVGAWAAALGLAIAPRSGAAAAESAASGFGASAAESASARSIPGLQPPAQTGGHPGSSAGTPVPPVLAQRPMTGFSAASSTVRAGLLALGLVLAVGGGWWYSRMRLAVAGVEALGPLLGDGKPVAVELQVQGREVAISRIEIRLVEGDGEWLNRQWSLEVPQSDRRLRRLPAGSLQIHAAESGSVTLEYVLVTEDGDRSPVFSRRFDIVPTGARERPKGAASVR